MTFRTLLLTAAAALALPSLAVAQTIEITAPSRAAQEEPALSDAPVEMRGTVEPDLDDETLAKALTFDPATLAKAGPSRSFRRPDTVPATSWSRSAPAPDGSSTVQVRKPITTSEWNASLGGELAIAGTPTRNVYDPPMPGATKDPRAGAAWANVEVPDVATFEARVAPSEDQRKASASVQRAVPIGSTLSVALENRVTVTEHNPNAGLIPAPLGATTVWGNERSVKLNVLATGTTFAAAASNATDPALNSRTFSAEQKIYGPLHVTTAVTNPGQPNASKSIGAGLKFDW